MPKIANQKEVRDRFKRNHPEYTREYYYLSRGLPVPPRRAPQSPEQRRLKETKITICECSICRAPYRKKGTLLTCSPECRKQHRAAFEAFKLRIKRKPRFVFACETCGKGGDSWSPRAKFCSADCKRLSLNARHMAKNREKKGQGLLCECTYCGGPFERNGHRKYCSPECTKSGLALNVQARFAPKPPRTVICKVCKLPFDISGPGKLCSPACVEINNRMLARHHRRSQRGAENKRRYMRRKRMDPVYKRRKNELKQIRRLKQQAAHKALKELGIISTPETAYIALKQLGIQI